MRRREFIMLVGSAAIAWPDAARAQQLRKLPTIGFLGQSTRAAASEWVAALVQRLRELGWIEGRTIAIEYRWSEGRDERSAEIAAEFVRLKVDIIVTSGTSHVLVAKEATPIIPIVFATAGDPVATGLVSSLARPGGNATGLATLAGWARTGADLGRDHGPELGVPRPIGTEMTLVHRDDALGQRLTPSPRARREASRGILIGAINNLFGDRRGLIHHPDFDLRLRRAVANACAAAIAPRSLQS
jgi:hypothetical protein